MLFKIFSRNLLILTCLSLVPFSSFAIDTPRDLRGTEIRQNTVKWEWADVSGAEEYQIYVNGRDVGTTDDTKFYSSLDEGYHTMYARSVDGNGDKSDPTYTVGITVSENFRFGTHGITSVVQEGSSSPDQQQDDNSSSSSGRLPAPSNTRGAEVSPREVLWEWDRVSGAVEYEVTVDGIFAGKTSDNEWTTRNVWFGDHSMTVKTVSGSGDVSEQSLTAKIYVTGEVSGSSGSSDDSGGSDNNSSSGSFGTPQNPRGTEISAGTVLWQWNSVAGAARYEVTVDGNFVGDTRSADWESRNLWVGTHSMTVKAVNDDGDRSEQSDTVKISVTGQVSDSSSGSSPPPPSEDNDNDDNDNNNGGDPDAADVDSLIDPASYSYSEVNNKNGWELVFSDEFNGNALNPYRWHSQLRWDGEWNGERYEYRTINGESQFYVNVLSPDPEHQEEIVPVYNPFKFDGNRLAIRAKVNPLRDRDTNRTHGRMMDIARQQPFLSGAISTHEKFARKYGYFEARIKIPDHTGTFPAFWLFHENRVSEGTQRTEIDIMENLGHAPHYIYNSFHYFTNVSVGYGGDANFVKPSPSGQVNVGSGHADDYHVYAVEWEPGKITWFIDGEQVSELSHREVDHEELYVMINLAIGGNWTNFPTNAGGLGRPSDQRYPTGNDIDVFSNPQLEIDYVRVYKRR